MDDLTGCLELLQGNSALVWENQNIPVLIAHSGNFELASELYAVASFGSKSPSEEEVYVCNTNSISCRKNVAARTN
jgi:hypothetical protein